MYIAFLYIHYKHYMLLYLKYPYFTIHVQLHGFKYQKIPSVFTEVIVWGALIGGGGMVFSCK